jgi:hypothetical protein
VLFLTPLPTKIEARHAGTTFDIVGAGRHRPAAA